MNVLCVVLVIAPALAAATLVYPDIPHFLEADYTFKMIDFNKDKAIDQGELIASFLPMSIGNGDSIEVPRTNFFSELLSDGTELKAMKRLFEIYDLDQDLSLTNNDIKVMFKIFDSSNDSSVSLSEFTEGFNDILSYAGASVRRLRI